MSLDKYISEFALNMQTERKAICRLSELDDLARQNYFNAEHPCHIYFITTRPKLTIAKNGLYFDDEKIVLKFKAQIEDTFEEVDVIFSNNRKSKNIRLETQYPYTVFKLFDQDKEWIYSNAGKFLQYLNSKNYLNPSFQKHLDLEILYIGQAYGKNGSRTAVDRLKSHSTLQSIYEEANKNNPDKDILLGLFTFKQWLLTSFDGRNKLNSEEMKLDDAHMKNVFDRVINQGITTQQEINFTEAALIKFFQPPYNIEYKDSFPNPAHSTYSECYDIDINSICLEVNTEDLFLRLYSGAVEASWTHFASFNLHSREDRITIFNLDYKV